MDNLIGLVAVSNDKITVSQEVVNKIKEFNKAKKEMEYQEQLLKDGLMEAMNQVGIKKFIIEGLSATIKDETVRKSLDTKRLQAECPDIYEAYLKESKVKSSITLSIGE